MPDRCSRFKTYCISLVLGITIHTAAWSAESVSRFLFVANDGNDLLQACTSAFGGRVLYCESTTAALDQAQQGDAILVLADGYPDKPTPIADDFLSSVRTKNVRAYLEYPSLLASGGSLEQPPTANSVERIVVSSSFFGGGLPRLSILQANGLHYLPTDSQSSLQLEPPLLVAARVAGFDTAVFGLPQNVAPLLAKVKEEDILIAATGLSRFRQGRYSPYGSWQTMWEGVLRWLTGSKEEIVLPLPPALVEPSFSREEPLPADAQRRAVEKSMQWHANAKLLIHPEWEDLVLASKDTDRLPRVPEHEPLGDGSLGSLEAVLSIIHADGRQAVSTARRGDCTSETAMAYAAASKLLGQKQEAQVARNLLNFYFFESEARKNERGDPEHPAYGLIAWGISKPAWYIANYGDDNARMILATMATAGLLGEKRWNEAIARCIVANLRTTGQLGFRGDRIDVEPLGKNGWQHYFNAKTVSFAPHFECYLWACYLWAYAETGDPLLLERAKTAIKMTMEQYPNGLRWTNGLAQERARILLPLAWLVRVEDSPEHRQLLMQAFEGLASLQADCGAIQEELGPSGKGMFPPPGTNEAYGTSEASLIARNGDPVADMLYTNNFALLGLHEAAAVTGDPKIREAESQLVDFLLRIQTKSNAVPEVDGGWLRAFDFQRWEPWGANADIGWGAWSIESGWTQGWITAVLAMRELDTSLWELMSDSEIDRIYPPIRESMLPQEIVSQVASEGDENISQ